MRTHSLCDQLPMEAQVQPPYRTQEAPRRESGHCLYAYLHEAQVAGHHPKVVRTDPALGLAASERESEATGSASIY